VTVVTLIPTLFLRPAARGLRRPLQVRLRWSLFIHLCLARLAATCRMGHLFLCSTEASVCRGYVTSDEGIRFCCKDAVDCTIMKHQVTKATLRDGFLYVKAPRADQGAYLEPALALTKVPETERLDVQSFLDRKNLRPL
jgi:hypothetical protein